MRNLRTGLGLLMLAGTPMLAGCGEETTTGQPRLPMPEVVRLPAASAGGSCLLLDYPVIEEITSVRFEVAAASRNNATNTCVVRAEAAEHPELVLSVSPTTADASVFADELVPKGGKTVKGLGKAAYQVTAAPAKGVGAVAEVGWLTGDGRLVSLRYTFPAGQDRTAADAFSTRLVALAKKIDASSL